MKDVYFSKPDSNNNDISYLTEEEKELIRRRREQNIRRLNSDDGFIRRPANPKTDTTDIPRQAENFRPVSQNYGYYGPARSSPPANSGINGNYNRGAPPYRQNSYNTYNTANESVGRNVQHGNVIPPRKPPAPEKGKKKKSGCGCLGATVIALLLVAVVLFAGTFGYVYSLMEKTGKIELQQTSSQNLYSDKNILNILLIGLDDDSGGNSRSDTMMLLSVDKKNKQLKLTSFLRDMWVEIPGHDSARLNASFAYGGASLTVQTLESNFHVDIDHAVMVDFKMFESIIDALDGIDVEITQKEANFINNTTSVSVKAGKNHLDGKSALVYARIRKLDSDFYRTQRQRKVISAIISKAVSSDKTALIKTLSKIMPLVKTDISAAELTKLAFGALRYIKYDIKQLQVPADDAYKSQTIKKQSVLVPDMEKNRNNIISFIYG